MNSENVRIIGDEIYTLLTLIPEATDEECVLGLSGCLMAIAGTGPNHRNLVIKEFETCLEFLKNGSIKGIKVPVEFLAAFNINPEDLNR